MEVTILGCRGSTPATGAVFERHGGDTSAVAVARDDQAPTLVLDAGTGLHRLGGLLGEQPFRGAILLSHLHWDHTHGLPFAPAVDNEEACVDLYLPAQDDDPLELLSKAIGPPHFPITPDGLRGRWRFHSLESGPHQIAGFEVLAADVVHKGGRTFGFRVSDGSANLAYIPDYWQCSGEQEPAQLVGGVDLLLHDSQHLDAELDVKGFLGHSSVEYAVALAARNNVARLGLFHHDPARTDAEIDAIVAAVEGGRGVEVTAAAAGLRYRL